MSPRPPLVVTEAYRQASKSHPDREPSDPPGQTVVETDQETRSDAATAATFRGPRFAVSLPSAVVVALVTAAGGWLAKPGGLNDDDRAALQGCKDVGPALAAVKAELADVKQEGRSFRQWVEPQIGLLLVRTDGRVYTASPTSPSK